MKKNISAILLILITTVSLQAVGDKSIVYANGVKDSLAVGERYFSDIEVFTNPNRIIALNGYAIFLNASELDEAKIVRTTAIGIKNGYDVHFIQLKGEDVIVFSVVARKADATYIQKRLASYNINTRIEKINVEAPRVNLVGRRMINRIHGNFTSVFNEKNNRISQLEKYIRTTNEKKSDNELEDNTISDLTVSSIVKPTRVLKCPKIKTVIEETISLKGLQVVNRVITKRYLLKEKKKGKKIRPLNNYTMSIMTFEKVSKQQKIVAKNIKRDFKRKLPNIKSFSKIYKYLRQHGGITKKDVLVLHGKAYRKDEKLLRWNITSINYRTGIIILDDSYSVQISSKGI